MADPKNEPTLPPFAGKALRDVPVPAATLWRDDEFGSAVLEQYNSRVAEEFGDNPHLNIFKVAAGIVHGSNPFAVCLVDMIVRPQVRVATMADLQAILDAAGKTETPVKMRGGYKDAGLVLRSVKEPNTYLAERLGDEVGTKIKWPLVIYLSGLEVARDSDSPCGLTFRFTRHTRTFHAPILEAESGDFSSEDVDPTTGLPTRIEGTGRYFYSMDKGLARLYLGRGSSVDTIWDELGNSQVDGRIVFVNNDIPPEQMSEYLRRLDGATRLLGY
ncbi:MAG: hypothetical protein ACYS1C_08470 [Planctomycetota bacterium]|jgi:hypothetical protein